MTKRAYKYRFYPTPEQAQLLEHTFGCTRFVYNWALNLRKEAYEQRQETISYGQTSTLLSKLKQEEEKHWLNDVSSVPLQQALRHLNTAFTNFFKKQNKYPRFKKKIDRQSAEFTRSGFKWVDGQLFLAKMKQSLGIRWSRDLPSGPSTVTVSKDRAGRYFVSLLCDCKTELLPVSPKTVGVDLGVKSVVITDDGWQLGNPKYTTEYERKLAKAQRSLSKKKLGSNNRLKAKRKVAKVHAKIADCRQDFTHKLTTKLVNENQVISVETLRVKNMLKNRKLSKAIADCNWGELTRQLAYKAEWYGRTLISIDQWFPSSKRCSNCGHTLDKLTLDVRHWTCPSCNTQHDRDVNAAKNIKAEGHSVLAFGESVSLVS